MKELLTLLIKCMAAENSCYCRMVSLAHDQMERLIAGRQDDLDNKNRLMEEQIAVLGNIYKCKEEVIARLASEHGLDKKDFIIEAKKISDSLADELSKAFEDLLLVVKELKFVKDVSGKLIDNAIKYTSFTLTTIHEVKRGKLLPALVKKNKNSHPGHPISSGGIYDQQLSVN